MLTISSHKRRRERRRSGGTCWISLSTPAFQHDGPCVQNSNKIVGTDTFFTFFDTFSLVPSRSEVRCPLV